MAGMLVQTGYNFLYGLWKYSWDADCELFLKILEEEIKEDVYTQQVQLQASLSLADMALPCHCEWCLMPFLLVQQVGSLTLVWEAKC